MSSRERLRVLFLNLKYRLDYLDDIINRIKGRGSLRDLQNAMRIVIGGVDEQARDYYSEWNELEVPEIEYKPGRGLREDLEDTLEQLNIIVGLFKHISSPEQSYQSLVDSIELLINFTIELRDRIF